MGFMILNLNLHSMHLRFEWLQTCQFLHKAKLSKENLALFMGSGFNVLSYAFYMPISVTELQLDDVNTIAIPTDAILIVSLLIVFALLGYLLNNILDNQKNQLILEIEDDSNLKLVKEKLEDQLTLESTTVKHERSEKPHIIKINFSPPS